MGEMRSLLAVVLGLTFACGDVVPIKVDGAVDGRDIDAPCSDTDTDGTCDAVDKCAGMDDRLDADSDTVPDGCDRCAGFDDRVDVNGNSVPDACDVQMRTVNVKQVGGNVWRGWHVGNGSSHTTTNDNTITGDYQGGSNSYFVFTLDFTAHSIVTATLELELENYTSTDASEAMSFWDVSTDAATVEQTGASVPIYTDLMSGTTYGTGTLVAANLNQVVSSQLNIAAGNDIKAKLGQDFVIGVHLVNAPPGFVRFSNASEARVARLVIRYLP
jgi:hypothetical protein